MGFSPTQGGWTQAIEGDSCPDGDSFCNCKIVGPVCFSPSTHTCANDELLCGLNAPNACGEACYSSSMFSCENEALVGLAGDETNMPVMETDAQECESLCNDRLSGPMCYDSNTHVCSNDELVCPLNAAHSCLDSCYSPDEYICQNGQLFWIKNAGEFMPIQSRFHN